MVLASFGINESEGTLARKLGTTKEVGTKEQPMIRVGREYGLVCRSERNLTLARLNTYIKCGYTIIVQYIELADNEDHFAVYLGSHSKFVTLNDPVHGQNYRVSQAEFLKRWRRKNDTYPKWAIICHL